MRTTLDNLCDVIQKELDDFATDTQGKLADSLYESAQEAKRKIKTLTPKGDRKTKYRNCFSVIPPSRYAPTLKRTLWNDLYMLSHLLEDGHLVYTRLGKKNDPSAPKIGPLQIKKRSANNGGTYAVFNDNKHTASYTNWKHTRDYTSEYLVENIKKKLS